MKFFRTLFLIGLLVSAPIMSVYADNYPLPDNIASSIEPEAGAEEPKALDLGDETPFFVLPNVHGDAVSLAGILTKGPVILSFYRGSRCPYCNDQLYSFQEILPEVEALGAQLVAVSPEEAKSGLDMALKKQLTFEVLHDQDNSLARKLDLVYVVPEDKHEWLNSYLMENHNKTLQDFNGVDKFELPIPATFVIDMDGTVAYKFQDEDYKKRADNNEVLAVLKKLKEKRDTAQN